MQFSETNLVAGSPRRVRPVADEIDNLCGDFASAPVKEDGFVAGLHAQDIAGMMRLAPAQNE
jgi:hypothetical protein